MKNPKFLKIIGIVAFVASFAVDALSDWVGEQKQDAIIDEKVEQALAKRDKES